MRAQPGDRKERLAAALRQNLKRRKAASRGRRPIEEPLVENRGADSAAASEAAPLPASRAHKTK